MSALDLWISDLNLGGVLRAAAQWPPNALLRHALAPRVGRLTCPTGWYAIADREVAIKDQESRIRYDQGYKTAVQRSMLAIQMIPRTAIYAFFFLLFTLFVLMFCCLSPCISGQESKK